MFILTFGSRYASIVDMFAVIKTGGKQYIVTPGQKLKVEKLPVESGKEVLFEEVLLLEGDPSTGSTSSRQASSGQAVEIGTPFITGAKVKGKVLQQGRGKKVVVFKFKNKKNQKKKKGHRQSFTEVEITSISS